MSRPKIELYRWHLWAATRRQDIRIGYYTQQPFYTPARAGNVMQEPSRESPPSDEDYAVVSLIDEAVLKLREKRPAQLACLEIYEGAYSGAPPERSKRYEKNKVRPETCKTEARKAKRWIENHLYPMLAQNPPPQ